MLMLKMGLRVAVIGLAGLGILAGVAEAQNTQSNDPLIVTAKPPSSPPTTAPASVPSAPIAVGGLTDQQLEELGKQMAEGTDLFKQAKYDEAARLFLQVAGKDPDNVDAELAYATAKFATGDYGAAALSIRRGVTKMPTVVDDPFDLHGNYGNPQQFDQHLKALEDHLKARPDDTDAKLVEGFVRHFGGQMDKGTVVFKEIQAKTPRDADIAGVFLMAKVSPPGTTPAPAGAVAAAPPPATPPPAVVPASPAPAPVVAPPPPPPPAPVVKAPAPPPAPAPIVPPPPPPKDTVTEKPDTSFDPNEVAEPVVPRRYQPQPAVPRPPMPEMVILCRGVISRDDDVAPKAVMTVDGIWIKVEDVDDSPNVHADMKVTVRGRYEHKYKNLPVGSQLNLLGLTGQSYRLRIETLEPDSETVNFTMWR